MARSRPRSTRCRAPTSGSRIGLREGKNREVRTSSKASGLAVNRLIRISFGPFQLLDLEPGAVEPVKRRVLQRAAGPRSRRRARAHRTRRTQPASRSQGAAQAQGLGMRIVGGQFRGRRWPRRATTRTRPTSDRVREAVFNILAHGIADFALEGARVLDLFAGTGALGLEALSRGAAFCLFVEEERRGARPDPPQRRGVRADRRHQDLPPRRHRPRPRRQQRRLHARLPRSALRPGPRRARARLGGGRRLAGARRHCRHRGAQGRGRRACPPAIAALDRRSWGDTQVAVRALRRRRALERRR